MVMTWGIVVYILGVGATTAVARLHRVRSEAPARATPSAAPELVRADALVRPTEEALRRLNKPASLADCSLAGYLPLSLKDLTAREGGAHASPHQALRAAIVQAVERLAPDDGGGEQCLPRAILADEYIRGHSTARIMARYAISESTFHRHRRDAIRAVAQDLIAREHALAALQAGRVA
jgi:hypothetical protein